MSLLRATAAITLIALLVAAKSSRDLPRDTLPEALPATPPRGLDSAEYVPLEVAGEVLALGRRLFFDPILSSDRTVACASCHQPQTGFADSRPLSVGVHGRETTRNAPTLFNRALGESFMWDGRAATLEEQVLQPIQNPLEMDLSLEDAVKRLTADEAYRSAFSSAFEREPTHYDLAVALASFVRRLWLGDSPVDQFIAGEVAALTPEERGGLWLWQSRGQCWRCHNGPNFTDEAFHNTGVGVVEGAPEEARFSVTKDEADRGRFKTPTLRGLAFTAPYMHDGSLATLEDVVEFYKGGGNANEHLDGFMKPIELSEQDAANLVAFLKALSRSGER